METVEQLYVDFGRLVRQLRKDAGLTQLALAKRVGLARTSITNIELGEQHIPLHLLYPLASALGATPDKLLPKTDHAILSANAIELDPDLAIQLSKQDLTASTKRWIQRVVMKTAIQPHGGSDEPRTARAKDTHRVRNQKRARSS